MRGLPVRLLAVVAVTAIAFYAGLTAGRAQAPSTWGPVVIHTASFTDADFPTPAPGAYARVKVLGRAGDTGVVQIQEGATKKHYHAISNEAQFILKGSGMFWLGDKQVPVGPGDLIIIPKGTAHGMDSNYEAIAFKSPPQAPDDIHPLP